MQLHTIWLIQTPLSPCLCLIPVVSMHVRWVWQCVSSAYIYIYTRQYARGIRWTISLEPKIFLFRRNQDKPEMPHHAMHRKRILCNMEILNSNHFHIIPYRIASHHLRAVDLKFASKKELRWKQKQQNLVRLACFKLFEADNAHGLCYVPMNTFDAVASRAIHSLSSCQVKKSQINSKRLEALLPSSHSIHSVDTFISNVYTYTRIS